MIAEHPDVFQGATPVPPPGIPTFYIFTCGMCERDGHSPNTLPPMGWDTQNAVTGAGPTVTCPDCLELIEERHNNRAFSRGMVEPNPNPAAADFHAPPSAKFMMHSGIIVDLLAPHADDIHIDDIAWHLSRIPRFNGGTKRFYSVAEHSVRVAMRCPPGHKLAGLLHDAAEAYLGDVVSPLKALLPDYRAIEARWDAAIAAKFVADIMAVEVKSADVDLSIAEARMLMPYNPGYWGTATLPELVHTIEGWKPHDAQRQFMNMFRRTGGVA